MGILSDLFGGSSGVAQTDPSVTANPNGGSVAPPAYTGLLPQHMNLPASLSDNNVAPVAVTASKKGGNANGYDNTPELQAIQNVAAKYPTSSTGSGLGLSNMIPDAMPGSGTLRNILGTLGDAFLIQSGHQPIHAQQRYNQQIANAAAGFDTDPEGAAARIAATGAPGSLTDATGMYNAAQTQQLRQSQQQSNNDYRQGNLAIRQQSVDARTQQVQDQIDQRNRALAGGILAAAAAKGDPAQYAAVRQQVIATYGPKISNFDADREFPEKMENFQAGYGMNANQVAHNATANASIAERATAANQHNATAIRGQNLNAGSRANATDATSGHYTQYLINKQNNGEQLTPFEQKYYDKVTHVNGGRTSLRIPGLTVGPGGGQDGGAPQGNGQAPQFQEGKVYVDAHGNKAKYSQGKWIAQ